MALLNSLVDLLADPKAAQKRVTEYADAVAKAGEAVKAAKHADRDKAAALADLADEQAAHERRLASEKAAHERAMAEREKIVSERELAAADQEKQIEREWSEVNAARADLKRRLEALRKAAE